MKRIEYDHYPTPALWAKAGVSFLPEDNYPLSLDIGAGDGVWGYYLTRLFDTVLTGIEIRNVPRPEAYTSWLRGDFRCVETHNYYDLVIGNPPYKLAIESVQYGLSRLKLNGHLLMLLRADLVGSQEHYSFWRRHKPKQVIYVADRPSFVGGGTDRYNYAFFLWQKGYTGQTQLNWTCVKDDFSLED